MPMEAGMMYTLDGDTFFRSLDWRLCCIVSHHEQKNGHFDVIDINESIQESSKNMLVIKKGKLFVNVQQVDGTEQVHTLWPVKFCHKAGANLFSLTCKLLQRKQISN